MQDKQSLVVFEHADFFVVNKPCGIDFHDEGKFGHGFFNQCQSVLGETLFPVHRLDKVTSGLVILARKLEAAKYFQLAFEQKKIHKFYVALGSSKPKKKQGSIIGDMVKARRSQWKLLPSKDNPAITRFKSVALNNTESASRLFLLKPQTGKTHQLRVAMKSLGTSIVGDDLYGGITADRTYLHAGRLCFEYQEQYIDVVCIPTEGSAFVANTDQLSEQLQAANSVSWPGQKSEITSQNE